MLQKINTLVRTSSNSGCSLMVNGELQYKTCFPTSFSDIFLDMIGNETRMSNTEKDVPSNIRERL